MPQNQGNSCWPLRGMYKRCERAGFTLIELLVVLVIMAIAAGMVVPYAVSTGDLSVISAARMLSCDLQFAQNSAITSQQPVKVAIDPSAESYSLVWSNTSTPLIHPMNKSDYVVDFPSMRGLSELNVVSANFGGATDVIFDVLGSPDNAGSVTLQAGPNVYVVGVLTATGKVTVTRAGS